MIKIDRDITQFIKKHRDLSTNEVALLLSKKPDWPRSFIIEQINGLQKAKRKFSFLLNYEGFLFPSLKAVAQSSSEITAEYKAKLVNGNTVIDICGGMGIDSIFFSKSFDRVFYIEPDKDLFKITKANFAILNIKNIESFSHDAKTFLSTLLEKVNCIYIDPDRRKRHVKAFRIEDCVPNLIELKPLLWKTAKQCLIKLSPMLDIHDALAKLEYCKEVHILGVNNECKELLFLLEKNYIGNANIICCNITNNAVERFMFDYNAEKICEIEYSNPLEYLYDPNTTLLKAGAFRLIAKKFNLKKLAEHTHLYTSSSLVDKFPGRTFKILNVDSPKKGFNQRANIISKNFPLNTAQIKKKYKISDGGNSFLFACSLADKRNVFITASKIRA